MATEAEISKIARLLWIERGKPANGLSDFREEARQLLENRDAICCPVQYTIEPRDKRLEAPAAQLSLSGAKRSETWPRQREVAQGQISSAGCDPAAEASDLSACLDAIDAALSSARSSGSPQP